MQGGIHTTNGRRRPLFPFAIQLAQTHMLHINAACRKARLDGDNPICSLVELGSHYYNCAFYFPLLRELISYLEKINSAARDAKLWIDDLGAVQGESQTAACQVGPDVTVRLCENNFKPAEEKLEQVWDVVKAPLLKSLRKTEKDPSIKEELLKGMRVLQKAFSGVGSLVDWKVPLRPVPASAVEALKNALAGPHLALIGALLSVSKELYQELNPAWKSFPSECPANRGLHGSNYRTTLEPLINQVINDSGLYM